MFRIKKYQAKVEKSIFKIRILSKFYKTTTEIDNLPSLTNVNFTFLYIDFIYQCLQSGRIFRKHNIAAGEVQNDWPLWKLEILKMRAIYREQPSREKTTETNDSVKTC